MPSAAMSIPLPCPTNAIYITPALHSGILGKSHLANEYQGETDLWQSIWLVRHSKTSQMDQPYFLFGRPDPVKSLAPL
jgi:hypothetical protein